MSPGYAPSAPRPSWCETPVVASNNLIRMSMLKKMVMAAVTALLAIGALTAQPNKGTADKQPSANQRPSPIVPAAQRQGQAADNKAKPDPDPPNWYAPFEQPEGMLVIVGTITFIIMGWQSWETRKAARAALLNAEAVINSERARILFEIENRLDERFRGVATFTIFAVNRGTVPAEIINYGKAEIARTPTNALPPEPKYQLADPPTVRFVASGERHPIAEFQPRMPGNTYRLLKDIEGPLPENVADIHLTVYGEVTYKDGISDQNRHSRYCFEWVHESGVIGGCIRPAGPLKYNDYT
jgi:hypothetical protein